MINVRRIMQKKRPTGEDLGRLDLANMMCMFSSSLKGKTKRLISREDFSQLTRRLIDPEQKEVYSGYLKIHEWYNRAFWMASAYQQQAYSKLNTLLDIITTSQAGENIYSYISGLPAIMTEKQYNDLLNKRKEETLYSQDAKKLYFDIPMLLDEALYYYVGLLRESPRKKNPLKQIKKLYDMETPTADPYILASYNETFNRWYYELADGTRSDKVSPEEWEEKLSTPSTYKAIEKYMNELMYGTPYTGLEEGNTLQTYKALFGLMLPNMEEPAPGEERQRSHTRSGELAPIEKYTYRKPPATVNKWEIVNSGKLALIYPVLSSAKWYYEDTKSMEELEAFLDSFPELTKALLKDMEKYIPGVSTLPVGEWLTTKLAWEDLYKMDYYSYKSFVEGDMNVFSGDRRAIDNGIAILRPSDIVEHSPRIDKETGYYKAPDISQTLTELTLESFFPESPNYKRNAQDAKDNRELVIDSYYFLIGYNLALELTADVFKVEEMNEGKFDMEGLKAKIARYNARIADLYKQISSEFYEDEALKEKKLDALKELFQPIDIEGLEVPEEAVEKAKADMKDNFRGYTSKDIIDTLCYK